MLWEGLAMATFISLFAAESITGLSRRTLWRRVADGVLQPKPPK